MSGPLIIGVESSCDETGVGIVRGRQLLANEVASAAIDRGEVLIGSEIEPYSSYSQASTLDFLEVTAKHALELLPMLGRVLTASDGEPGAEPVVVLRESVWRRRFGARWVSTPCKWDGSSAPSRGRMRPSKFPAAGWAT